MEEQKTGRWVCGQVSMHLGALEGAAWADSLHAQFLASTSIPVILQINAGRYPNARLKVPSSSTS